MERTDVAAAVCGFLTRAREEATAKGSKDNAASLQVALDCVKQVFPVSEAHLSAAPHLESVISTTGADTAAVDVDAEAAKLKEKGNELMAAKDYMGAYTAYTDAIRIKKDAIFFGNRAAASISMGKYEAAIEDCKQSLKINPNYVKSHARMGHAYKALGKNKEALAAYEEAVRCDPANQNYKAFLDEIKATAGQDDVGAGEEGEEEAEDDEQEHGGRQAPGASAAEGNPFSSLLGSLGGQGTGGPAQGPGGGMDLGNLLNNPAVMQMASSVMSNPDMQQMLGGFMSNLQQQQQQPQQQQQQQDGENGGEDNNSSSSNTNNNNNDNGNPASQEEEHHRYYS